MAYLKPPAFQRRVFNKLAMRFGMGGVSTLTVAGRRSGRPLRVPVIPVDVDGARYLVSTRGDAEWVRNLRSAGGAGSLKSRNGTETFRAVEVPVAERPPILTAYKAKAGAVVKSYFAKLPDPADHPVFRMGPRE